MAPATENDADAASAILLDVAKWLFDRGIEMWPPEMLVPAALKPAIDRRELYLAYFAGTPVGVMMLQWEDQFFWPDIPAGQSAFIHRLAVRRSVAGQGVARTMVEWAREMARAAGRKYLRLDCDGRRPRLCAFYESLGFSRHSERQMGSFFVARYECHL